MSIKRTQGSGEISFNVSSAKMRDILHRFKGKEFLSWSFVNAYHEHQKRG